METSLQMTGCDIKNCVENLKNYDSTPENLGRVHGCTIESLGLCFQAEWWCALASKGWCSGCRDRPAWRHTYTDQYLTCN